VKGGEGWSSGDMRWRTVPQTSGHVTGNALSTTVDSRVRRKAKEVDKAEHNSGEG